jgi:hypothetical protein
MSRSQKSEVGSHIKKRNTLRVTAVVLSTVYCLLSTVCYAELIDRVVAFVDDKAITLSELNETHDKTKKVQPDISRREVLNTMINRVLLLNEAKRLRLEEKTDDQLINEYIEMKIKAFIRIKEEDLKEYYVNHISEFKEAGYEAVRDKIEEYLTEKEINELLRKHITELKSKAYIKIVMKDL